MMSLKTCPYCAEEIQPEAIKCKHCGSWLTGEPDAPAPGTSSSPLFGTVPAGRLTRSSSNRMFAGVCGGLGQYFGVDPTLVRILVAVATFFSAIAPGLVLYLILSFVIPSDDSLS